MLHSAKTFGQRRLLAVDTLRGFAMVLVMLQHAYLSANIKAIPHMLDMALWVSTSLAAVAFVAISGMMCSYFLYESPNRRMVYRRYIKRAAFLLLAAHPAINLMSYYFRMAGDGNLMMPSITFMQMFIDPPITDTIALCMIVAPMFVIGLRPGIRAVAIMIMLVTTILIRAFVIPSEDSLVLLKEALFGGLGEPKIFWFPLIPWLAIFLSGSFAGQALAFLKQETLDVFSFVKGLKKAGFFLAVCSVVLIIGYKGTKVAYGGTWNPDVFRALYPGQTTALLPGYLGVLTLLFALLIQRIDIYGCYDRLAWCLSIFGRTSLFTYVVQFAVVESIPALLGFKGTLGLVGFLVLFFTGVIIMWILSYIYGRLRGWFQHNDYIKRVSSMSSGLQADS